MMFAVRRRHNATIPTPTKHGTGRPYMDDNGKEQTIRKEHRRSALIVVMMLGVILVTFISTCAFFRSSTAPEQSRVSSKIYPQMLSYESGARLNATTYQVKYPSPGQPPLSWHRGDPDETSIAAKGLSRVDDDGCVFRDWHYKQTYMTCNKMHEMELLKNNGFSFSGCGTSRCVIRLSDDPANAPTADDADNHYLAFKFERLHRNGRRQWNEYLWRNHRMDYMAMERLSASPYVPDIFASCAAGHVVQFADRGSIHDLVKVARQTGIDKLSSIDKLRISVQVAAATADIHSFEGDGVPSLAHNDLNLQQFVYIDGIYKINDFADARLLPKHAPTNTLCLTYNDDGVYGDHYRKIKAHEFFDSNNKVDQSKADTYSMGDVMYNVLTTKWMFEGERLSDVKKRVSRGEHPTFPQQVRESRDPAIKAIVQAINWCWTHDPQQRPTSRQVSDLLNGALKSILNVEELGVVHVSVPALPEGHRYTFNDMYQNLLYDGSDDDT